jgi:hypothetical protein
MYLQRRYTVRGVGFFNINPTKVEGAGTTYRGFVWRSEGNDQLERDPSVIDSRIPEHELRRA